MPRSFLEVTRLTKTYDGVKAVQDASLVMGEGEFIGLIGPNGAGKTTFSRLISGILRASSGSVVFRGSEVTHWVPERRARLGLAITHQIVRPWRGMSALDNVVVAAGHQTLASEFGALLRLTKQREREAAMAILDRLGLSEVANKYPEVLPLGMLKRLEVARALALKPKLLLLDEPLAGLNQREAGILADVFVDLNREGLSIILVEHNLPEVLRITKRLVVFDAGAVIADGPPETTIADDKVREAYIGGPRSQLDA
jgi:branched-chain amino acid transport system ATP-binding protein